MRSRRGENQLEALNIEYTYTVEPTGWRATLHLNVIGAKGKLSGVSDQGAGGIQGRK